METLTQGVAKDLALLIFHVFGMLVVSAIYLLARIREQRLKKSERLDCSGTNNVKITNVTLSLVGMEALGKTVQYRLLDW